MTSDWLLWLELERQVVWHLTFLCSSSVHLIEIGGTVGFVDFINFISSAYSARN